MTAAALHFPAAASKRRPRLASGTRRGAPQAAGGRCSLLAAYRGRGGCREPPSSRRAPVPSGSRDRCGRTGRGTVSCQAGAAVAVGTAERTPRLSAVEAPATPRSSVRLPALGWGLGPSAVPGALLPLLRIVPGSPGRCCLGLSQVRGVTRRGRRCHGSGRAPWPGHSERSVGCGVPFP